MSLFRFAIISNLTLPTIMNLLTFEPQLTSTPKKLNTSVIIPNLCSTPRPSYVRYSLDKCAPFPVHSSTPNSKKIKKSFALDIHRLIYPSKNSNAYPMKIWVL